MDKKLNKAITRQTNIWISKEMLFIFITHFSPKNISQSKELKGIANL